MTFPPLPEMELAGEEEEEDEGPSSTLSGQCGL